jgi:uncharacterized protein YndB with AHSA1/START domain
MELGSIEREMRMDASPEVVFEVLSRPEHICEWWSDEAALEPAPGATGELVWRDQASADTHVARITVVDAEPPRLFSFRWVYSEGEVPARGNSLLVRFELVPVGDGTLVRLTETGFRERGWEAAVAEKQHREHSAGWDLHLPHLVEYVAKLVPRR